MENIVTMLVVIFCGCLAALAGYAKSKSELDIINETKEVVKERGIEWALKELALSANKSSAYSMGLREGLRSLDT